MGIWHRPLLAGGLFQALGGGTSLLDVVEYPICAMGEQWLTSSLEEGTYRSANNLLYLLLIMDIFLHCNKQDGNSRVMVGSSDL